MYNTKGKGGGERDGGECARLVFKSKKKKYDLPRANNLPPKKIKVIIATA